MSDTYSKNRRLGLVASCAFAALIGCQQGEQDSFHCDEGQCDEASQSLDLMPRAPSTPGTVAITRNQDAWLFEVIGAKGEIVLLSEAYADKSSAINGILSVEENGIEIDRYLVDEGQSGWAFTLLASNGEAIADSQSFPSEEAAEAGARHARDLVAGIVQYEAAVHTGAGFQLDREGGKWHFTLENAEGELVLQSQAYSSRRDAIRGIESVRKNGKEHRRYVPLDGPPRFILKAGNGEEIAESSQNYPSLEDAREAILSTQELLVSERVANPW